MSTQALKSIVSGEKKKNQVAVFRDFLEKHKGEIANALPKHLNPERVIRLATTEFAKNKALQQCTAVSIYGGIIQAAQLGLEIGVMGQAYLVPFKSDKTGNLEAQFIPGYKGLISLARRSGEVTSIETHIVYEHDVFSLKLGLETKVEHIPFLEGDRGKPKLVYGVARFRDGGHHFEWMSVAEVNRIRDERSKAAKKGPWVSDYEQMVRKTLIRRMANYLPMSIELENALQIDAAVAEGKKASIEGDFVKVEDDEAADPAKEPVSEPVSDWQPSPEELEKIRARELAEAGMDSAS